jgi:hypothetical protein
MEKLLVTVHDRPQLSQVMVRRITGHPSYQQPVVKEEVF